MYDKLLKTGKVADKDTPIKWIIDKMYFVMSQTLFNMSVLIFDFNRL